jgi:hypothetical protein
VINAGIPGYWTGPPLLTPERVTTQYAPDLVLLMMVNNDDISYEEEVRRGFIPRPDDNLFNLGSQVRAIRSSDHQYDYTNAMAEARKLSELCTRLGSRLAVVVFRSTSDESWGPLVEAARATFAGTDVPVLDLGETLLNGRAEEELFVHAIDHHPNEIGHRLAAEAIDRWLTDTHLID